jgi:uncharacterized protein (DUF302 family)
METKRTSYSFGTNVPWAQEEAIHRVTAALKEEGFGVLTTIDVKRTLKEKIEVDRPPYVILGACAPALANQALIADPEIGVLLPCNVVVYELNGQTRVTFMDPEAALSLTENEQISELASEVRQRLERVMTSLNS